MRKIALPLILISLLLIMSCGNDMITPPIFDEAKAKREISQMIIKFMRAFEKLMYLTADEIIKDFISSCGGREHQKQTILNHQSKWDKDPFTLEVQFLSSVTFGSINTQEASGVSITNKFISVRKRDGYRNAVIATHIYTNIVENNRWWICDYKVVYDAGSEALFNKLFIPVDF